MSFNIAVIGCISGYKWDNVRVWSKSLDATNPTATKILLTHGVPDEDIKIMRDNNILVYELSPQSNPNNMRDRFLDISEFLKDHPELPNHIIVTDVGDVLFQDKFDQFLGLTAQRDAVFVFSENIRLKDDPWAVRNMTNVFGQNMCERMKQKESYCAGVFVSTNRETLANIFDLIYQFACRFAPNILGGGSSDQAILNYLISTKLIDRLVPVNSPFCVHVGTSYLGISSGSGEIGMLYKMNPYFARYVENGDLFIRRDLQCLLYSDITVKCGNMVSAIVHQWNRVERLKKHVEKTY